MRIWRLQIAPSLHQVLLKLVAHLLGHRVALSLGPLRVASLASDELMEASQFLELHAIADGECFAARSIRHHEVTGLVSCTRCNSASIMML